MLCAWKTSSPFVLTDTEIVFLLMFASCLREAEECWRDFHLKLLGEVISYLLDHRQFSASKPGPSSF